MLAILAGCASNKATTKSGDPRSSQPMSDVSQASSTKHTAVNPAEVWDPDEWPPSADELEKAAHESLHEYTRSDLQDAEVRRIAPTRHPWTRLLHASTGIMWFESNGPSAVGNLSGEQSCKTIAGDWLNYRLDGVAFPRTGPAKEGDQLGRQMDNLASDSAATIDQRPCMDDRPQGSIQYDWNLCYWYALGCAGDVHVPLISWGMRNRGLPPALPTTTQWDRTSLAVWQHSIYLIGDASANRSIYRVNLQSRSQPEIFVAQGALKVLTGADAGLVWVDTNQHIKLTSYDGKHTIELGEMQDQIAQAVSWHQKLAIQTAGEIQLLDIERHKIEAKIAVRSEPKAGVSLDDEYLVWPDFDDGEICRYELRTKSQSCRNVGGHPISVVRRGERLFWNDASKQGVFEAKFVGFAPLVSASAKTSG